MGEKRDNSLTKKQLCREFYNKWEGPKISFTSFYQQYRLGKLNTMEEMITPKYLIKAKKKKPHKGKRANEMSWWDDQLEPKSSTCLFRNRLNAGYSKEEAILTGEEWLKARRSNQEGYKKICMFNRMKQIDTPAKKEPPKFSDCKIEITYPKEVAEVFREEYCNLISDVEEELRGVEESILKNELLTKLKCLKEELMVFNARNEK